MHKLFFLMLFIIPLQTVLAETDMYYMVGDHLVPITLKDQHDKLAQVNETTRVVLFTRDMPGGKVVRKVLDEEGADFLKDNHTIFLSNISGMPGMVAKMIALPRMRKHSYSIALDRDGETTKRIPSKDGNATILILEDLKIKSITFTKDSTVLKNAVLSADIE